MRALELKIPPAALVLIAAFLMWLTSISLPILGFLIPMKAPATWFLMFGGLLVSALGFLQFRRANTSVNPTKPGAASSLVTSGIYCRTRNPMYVGFVLILAGTAVSVANIGAFFFLPAFIIYMNRFQIEPEERALTSLFGDDFRAYCSAVPRWI